MRRRIFRGQRPVLAIMTGPPGSGRVREHAIGAPRVAVPSDRAGLAQRGDPLAGAAEFGQHVDRVLAKTRNRPHAWLDAADDRRWERGEDRAHRRVDLAPAPACGQLFMGEDVAGRVVPVSYTHLTLPTIY